MLRFSGERLKAIRTQNGITQYTMAKDCDFGIASMSRWENNSNIPNLVEVYKMARYFKIPMEYFVIDDKQ